MLVSTLVVAHGRVVTSSHQIIEVKQRLARLVFGWVSVLKSRCCPCVEVLGKSRALIMPRLSIQQWWVPGGMRKLHCNDWLSVHQSEQMLNSPQRRWDCIRESSNIIGCKLWSVLNSKGYQTKYIHILHFHSLCIRKHDDIMCSLSRTLDLEDIVLWHPGSGLGTLCTEFGPLQALDSNYAPQCTMRYVLFMP